MYTAFSIWHIAFRVRSTLHLAGAAQLKALRSKTRTCNTSPYFSREGSNIPNPNPTASLGVLLGGAINTKGLLVAAREFGR